MVIMIVLLVIIVTAVALYIVQRLSKSYRRKLTTERFCESVVPGTVFQTTFQRTISRYGRLLDKVLDIEHDASTDKYSLKLDTIVEVPGSGYTTSIITFTDADNFVHDVLAKDTVEEVIKSGVDYLNNHQYSALSFDFNKKYTKKVCRFVYTRSFSQDKQLSCIASFRDSYSNYIFIGHPLMDGETKCKCGESGFDFTTDNYTILPITQEEYEKWEQARKEFNKDIEKANKPVISESYALTPYEKQNEK